MKRLLSWILILAVLLSMAACGKKDPEAGQAVSPEQQQEILAETVTKTGEFLRQSVAEPTFGSVGGEWLILGLARSDLEIKDEYYETYFQNLSTHLDHRLYSPNPGEQALRFGLFQFRSPLLSESLLFSLPPAT